MPRIKEFPAPPSGSSEIRTNAGAEAAPPAPAPIEESAPTGADASAPPAGPPGALSDVALREWEGAAIEVASLLERLRGTVQEVEALRDMLKERAETNDLHGVTLTFLSATHNLAQATRDGIAELAHRCGHNPESLTSLQRIDAIINAGRAEPSC